LKKTITIFLALVYFGTSTGATIHMHYCMGKMTGWGLVANASDKCTKCGMQKAVKKDGHCCKDEVKFFKNNTDQKTNALAFLAISLATGIITANGGYVTPDICIVPVKTPVGPDPPRTPPVAVFILHQSFLI